MDSLKRMKKAKNFPENTCPASRHVEMIATSLINNKKYPMLEQDPEHCGQSMASVVASLWEERHKNKLLQDRLLATGVNQSIIADIEKEILGIE